MKKYGKQNFIEIEGVSKLCDHGKVYHILERDDTKRSRNVVVDGQLYSWVMSCYSKEHSMDEDCEVSFMTNGRSSNYGFPQKVSTKFIETSIPWFIQ
jgi:hypothetical protein